MTIEKIKNKTIILCVPDHFGLPERFKQNLEAIGFITTVITDNFEVKIGLKNTLIHGYKKFIKGYKTFKKEKKNELKLQMQLDVLEKNCKRFDYSLFIRPDLFSSELINIIKGRSDKLSAYQWDGLDRYPLVYKRIDLFDRFFVFDVNDLSKSEKLLPLTNFYFDDIPISEDKTDVYFVGTYMKNRIDLLLKLARKCKELGLTTSINLNICSAQKAEKLKEEPITIITKPISFTQNIINVSKSKIILDFANNVHFGISMRTFETIGYKKKLITNNELVKKYDFYNPNNIFVIENDQLDGLEEFLSIPYEDLSNEINTKYSFTNWIKYVLDIEPHIPINLRE